MRAGISNIGPLNVNVPDDGFRRQRVPLVLADCLMKTLCSRVYVREESSIVSVGWVKVSGELRLVKKCKLMNKRRDRDGELPRTKTRAAFISSTAIFRAAQSTSVPCSFSSVEGDSDI